ncbi:MAG TPA: bifunctional diguanylate cyclase/phosphodiesterase [Mycobacteriales bacterium]|nr:bifunctional diguanylate cyclase/phosphodiesterase [Mycobacteriales bacterium]
MEPTTPLSRTVVSRVAMAAGAALAGAAFAVVAVWLVGRLPGSRAVGDLASVAAAGLAAAAGLVAARRTHGRVRRGWLLLATGCGIDALGQLSWTAHQLGSGVPAPDDWLTSGLLIGSVAVSLPGLLLLPARRLDRRRALRLLLDVLMVGTALGVAGWALIIGPALARPGGGRMVLDYGLPYSVAAVVTLAVVVLVAAQAGGRWLVPVLLVCGGLAVRAIGRLALVGLIIRDEYTAGGALDLCWIAGFGLIAAAALRRPADWPAGTRPAASTAERSTRVRVLLPYLPVVVALIAAAVAGPGLRGPGLVLGSVAVIVLLLARQVLTALDNAAFAAEETRMAYSDPLTGLGNRALLAAEVARAQRAARGGDRLSLLLLDLDGFKAVNDSLGHEAGDRLLVRLAERLAATVGPEDVVARLGGDEFAVLVEAPTPGAGLRTARRLLDALGAPVEFSGRTVRVTVSIGVVEQVGGDTGDVLRDADVAMYAAKAAGKACVRQFEPAMRRAVVARAELEADLRHALDRGEFRLRFQPVVDLDTREVRGAEALVRWQHPRRGLLAPDSFIPLATEVGLVGELDRWVMDEASRIAAGWQLLKPGVTISVNVTADRFAATDLVGAVADALAETGLPPHCLTLELTETALVADAEATISRLGALGALGVQVAIDDFGTGYSSLAYLHRLPASILKIDKSFVEGLGTNAESTALVRVIMGLADTFGLRTIAEGVETESQRALLRALGCTRAQGYLFAPPLEAADLEALLAGPARGVGAARLRAPHDELAAGDPPEPMPEPPLPADEEPAEEPAARGVGPARLRLLPTPADPDTADTADTAADPADPTEAADSTEAADAAADAVEPVGAGPVATEPVEAGQQES